MNKHTHTHTHTHTQTLQIQRVFYQISKELIIPTRKVLDSSTTQSALQIQYSLYQNANGPSRQEYTIGKKPLQ